MSAIADRATFVTARLQRIALLAFSVAAFAIRAPLMFPLELHTDEDTFLNVGHDVALGHLPYLHMWDLKPPLLFILVAPITVLADHHVWAVRLFATLLDIVTCLLAKKAADRLFGEALAHWFAAILCFAAMTTWVAGGALMSETVALPFVMGAALLLCRPDLSAGRAFAIGALLGAATLIRGTPVFAAAAVVTALLGQSLFQRDGRVLRLVLFVVLGGLSVLALITLPYALAGELRMLAASEVLAPMSYVGEHGENSLLQLFSDMAQTSRLSSLAFGLGFAGLAYSLASPRPKLGLWRVVALFLGQLVGVVLGPAGGFYLAILVPFACVFAAPLLALLVAAPRPRWARVALSAILVLPLLVAAKNSVARGGVHDTMAEILGMLSAEMKPGDTLYLTTDYKLYWLLDRIPPHPIVTHPGNLFKPAMFGVLPFGMHASADVMGAIVATRPTWIVFSTENLRPYEKTTEVGKILQPVIAADYDRQPAPAGRLIYRLRDAEARK